MTVDNIVHVLKHHCGALLYLLRGVQYRRCAALCRTQRRGSEKRGLDLVAAYVGEPDRGEHVDTVHSEFQTGMPIDRFDQTARGGRGHHVIAHSLGLHLRAGKAGVIAPDLYQHRHTHHLLPLQVGALTVICFCTTKLPPLQFI